MKKLFVLVASVFMLQACDDGDITLQSFNFGTASIQKCSNNNLIFKTKGKELLIVNVPFSSFENSETPIDNPRIIPINNINQVVYRIYSDNVSSSTVCATLPPSIPVVEKEWNATGGSIQVISRAIYAPNNTTITGYTHNIKFVNINFSGISDSFSFTEYLFGNYETSL